VLDVCLLGTGGMMPLPDRWLTSLLIRNNGRMILIDCGEGTQIPIKMAEWGFKAIDAVLFTHYHADHIAGLPGFLLTLGNSGRTQPLTLMGPPGIKRVVEGITVISPELPYELKLIELSDIKKDEKCISNISIKSIPVEHTLACLAYSIEIKRQGKFDVERAKQLGIPINCWSQLQKGEVITVEHRIITPDMVLGVPRKGIKVCYCTDSRPTVEMIEFINCTDLFICEGMYADNKNADKAIRKKHMTFSEAGLLAKKGKVKELWLTHFSPSLTDPEQYIDTVRAIFPNSYVGKDMLTKTIRYEEL